MIKVNYGDKLSEETCTRILNLMKGEAIAFDGSVSEDILFDIMKQSGDKVLEIVSGNSIAEATAHLQDNTDEVISSAAVLIKATPDYQFLPIELTGLLRYFDSYPMDPKITWGYCLHSNQENPITIIILKNTLSNK